MEKESNPPVDIAPLINDLAARDNHNCWRVDRGAIQCAAVSFALDLQLFDRPAGFRPLA